MAQTRANDWRNQVAPPELTEAPATASKMTIEHLGSSATEADLEEFRGWVRTLMQRTGWDEQFATDTVWNDGDFMAAVETLQLA